MDALVLAGGASDWVKPEGVTAKALLRLQGQTLLARVVQALRASRPVERLCVVGPAQLEVEARACGADLFVAEGGSAIDNLIQGLRALDAEGRVILSACDLPLLRSEDVEEVVEATPHDADLSYPVIRRDAWQAMFPASPKRFIRLADGEFVGGSLFVQHAEVLRRIEPLARRAFEARRNQAAMASLLGVGTLIRLILGHLMHPKLGPSLEGLRRQAERMTGARCAVVWDCSPRIGADVDHLRSWEWLRGLREPYGSAEDRGGDCMHGGQRLVRG